MTGGGAAGLPSQFFLVWSGLALSAADDRLFLAAVDWFATAEFGPVVGTVGVVIGSFAVGVAVCRAQANQV
ncbi:hypothetical protein Ais01nite_74870 [Asanoa ishikariensis]|uniref:hypothetical protein n=1 Tax=Asanoa ishikariensis TaxID=137265 RepID=UPI000B87A671|nr:hypothetical protein [Asanoa ishikariensis]GIF69452.1 hypothetical protein Ais01nite_74870 [Asanoa ishikariensis]